MEEVIVPQYAPGNSVHSNRTEGAMLQHLLEEHVDDGAVKHVHVAFLAAFEFLVQHRPANKFSF